MMCPIEEALIENFFSILFERKDVDADPHKS